MVETLFVVGSKVKELALVCFSDLPAGHLVFFTTPLGWGGCGSHWLSCSKEKGTSDLSQAGGPQFEQRKRQKKKLPNWQAASWLVFEFLKGKFLRASF